MEKEGRREKGDRIRKERPSGTQNFGCFLNRDFVLFMTRKYLLIFFANGRNNDNDKKRILVKRVVDERTIKIPFFFKKEAHFTCLLLFSH